MKRALAAFLTIGIILNLWAGTALAERVVTVSGQCGPEAYWALYEDGELIISGSGATYDYGFPRLSMDQLSYNNCNYRGKHHRHR